MPWRRRVLVSGGQDGQGEDHDRGGGQAERGRVRCELDRGAGQADKKSAYTSWNRSVTGPG
jgi:hypothetical protein